MENLQIMIFNDIFAKNLFSNYRRE